MKSKHWEVYQDKNKNNGNKIRFEKIQITQNKYNWNSSWHENIKPKGQGRCNNKDLNTSLLRKENISERNSLFVEVVSVPAEYISSRNMTMVVVVMVIMMMMYYVTAHDI